MGPRLGGCRELFERGSGTNLEAAYDEDCNYGQKGVSHHSSSVMRYMRYYPLTGVTRLRWFLEGWDVKKQGM